jgi:hypothetical protein
VSGRITRWLLLFLEYEFTVVYKPNRTHVIADVLSILLNNLEPFDIQGQTMDTLLFFVKPIWMQEVKTYLGTGKMPKTLNLIHKQKLARKAKPFILKKHLCIEWGKTTKCGDV